MNLLSQKASPICPIFILVLLLVSQLSFAQEGFNEKERKRARTCQRIFNELKEAQGLSQFDKPILEMVVSLNPTNFKIALVDNEGVVQFDRASMNLCYKMEDDSLNAIAFVLSHELAHYIHQHVIVNKFIEEKVGIETQGEDLRTTFDIEAADSADSIEFAKTFAEVLQNLKIRENEAQADLEAGFTSYLAGYQTKYAGPDFFQRAYDRFKMNTTSEKYVSLSERKEIMKYAGEKLDTLIQVFEAANYLTTIKEFELAEHCYDFVAKDYKNKVILNNMGVLQLRKYLSLVYEDYIKYVVPITMDLDFAGGSKGDQDELEEQFRRLEAPLNKAIYYFEQASLQSKTYALPYLNKSISYLLLHQLKSQPKFESLVTLPADDLIFAKSAALQVKQIELKTKNDSLNMTLSNAYGMLAVISHELDAPRETVDSLFNLGLREFPLNPTIHKNMDIIYEGEPLTIGEDVGLNFAKCCNEETLQSEIPNQPLVAPYDNFDFSLELANSPDKGTFFFFTAKKSDSSHTYNIFESSVEDSIITMVKNRVGIVIPTDTSLTTACDVNHDSTFEDLQASYGSATDSILSLNGTIYYYKGNNRLFGDNVLNDGIIFNLVNEKNAQGIAKRVKNWAYIQKQILIE